MAKIISFQAKEYFDVNTLKTYKYAIPEHEPILLSNGLYLYSYRVTPYDEYDAAYGDFDEECYAVEREIYD